MTIVSAELDVEEEFIKLHRVLDLVIELGRDSLGFRFEEAIKLSFGIPKKVYSNAVIVNQMVPETVYAIRWGMKQVLEDLNMRAYEPLYFYDFNKSKITMLHIRRALKLAEKRLLEITHTKIEDGKFVPL